MDHPSILVGKTKQLSRIILLHKYFEKEIRQVDERGKKTGIYFQEQFLSYRDLNTISNRVARGLYNTIWKRSKFSGHSPKKNEVIIAVDMEPCIELIIAIVAILKLGATYLPMDSHSAINRVKYILNETNPVCIVVNDTSIFKTETDTVWSCYFIVDIHEIIKNSQNVISVNLTDAEQLGSTNNLGIIYTSGSTGNPKGVYLTHHAAMNRLTWQWNEATFKQTETGCFKTSLLFVDSVVEIFGCMLQLVPLVVAYKGLAQNPEAFVNLLDKHCITRLTVAPSLLRNILLYIKLSENPSTLQHLTFWISNSEPLNPSLLEMFFSVFPSGKTISNYYGSTETLADVTSETFTCLEDIDSNSSRGLLSVGVPMYNNNVYVVDEDTRLLPCGVTGEICVSGRNLSKGYVDSGQSLAIPNPFEVYNSRPAHEDLLKTGDYGHIYNGKLICEGRRDSQVKIRGQRVNTMEIEKAVQVCSDVDKSIVLCHRFSEISQVIVAYYTTKHNGEKSTISESIILDSCRKSLPVYMRPKLLHVHEIPLQAHSGKVDVIALRKLYEKAFNRKSSEELAILDEKSQKALNIIALNLNMPTHAIPRKSSFFELGGNSIAMIATIVQLKDHGLHIPIEEFSGAKTIEEIIDQVTISSNPIGEILHTDKYVVKPLGEVQQTEGLIDLLADSFVEKEPLLVLLGVTKTELMPFAHSLYQESKMTNLSLVVLEKKSQKIVGGDFLFDYFEGVKVQHHESMIPILKLLREFEEPVKERLICHKMERLLFNFCLCVHKDLPHAEQVKICHLIEGVVIEVAKNNGYSGVITNNTNPVTQVSHLFYHRGLHIIVIFDFKIIKVQLDGIMHKWANPHKKTMKICVIDRNNLINIRVSHSGLDHLVTDFVDFLC